MVQKLIFALALAGSMLLHCPVVLANSTGIPFYSGKDTLFCSQCHSGGVTPSVALQGPHTLDVGMTGEFTFTVHSNRKNQQIAAGVGIAASDNRQDAFSPGPGMQLIFGTELTHSRPHENDDNGDAVFTFGWTAPMVPGTYTIFGAGNSVNLNTLVTGDAAAKTTIMVVVGKGPSPTQTPTATPIPPTATATPTRTLVPSHTPTETRSPTLTPTQLLSATATIPGDTPTQTPTPSSTLTPTRAVTPGDANCNNRITAADLVPIVRLAVSCDAGCEIDNSVCGVDVNRDHQINQLDIDALIQLLF